MSNITQKERTEIIKKTFKEFNDKNGFYFRTPRVILKDNYDIIHYLTIAINGGGGITCDLVTQPLYLPETSLNLNISVRLNFIEKTKLFPWGHYDDSVKEYEDDIADIFHVFSTGGIEWFSTFGSPQKLIDVVDDWSLEKYKDPWHPDSRNETRAVSYLYLGEIDKGIYYLKQALLDTQMTETFQKWLNLAQNESERLPEIFDDIILTTRKNLKLKDEKCELLNKRKLEETNKIIL